MDSITCRFQAGDAKLLVLFGNPAA